MKKTDRERLLELVELAIGRILDGKSDSAGAMGCGLEVTVERFVTVQREP